MINALQRSIDRYLAFLDTLTEEQSEALGKYHTSVLCGYIEKLQKDYDERPDPNLKAIIKLLKEIIG